MADLDYFSIAHRIAAAEKLFDLPFLPDFAVFYYWVQQHEGLTIVRPDSHVQLLPSEEVMDYHGFDLGDVLMNDNYFHFLDMTKKEPLFIRNAADLAVLRKNLGEEVLKLVLEYSEPCP